MHYEILDNKRRNILPLLKEFKEDFYMAGGTALALQIGHRDSIDFDFFYQGDFDTTVLFTRIKKVFSDFRILKIQEDKNTLTVLIDDNIKISFFSYDYNLLKDKIEEENFYLASKEDIACMKLSAILGRASNKDYVDLYFILQEIDLSCLLDLANKKFSDIDINLILKSLVYFDDMEEEKMLYKNNFQIDFEDIKKFLIERVSGIN